jgi:hypothetical protein
MRGVEHHWSTLTNMPAEIAYTPTPEVETSQAPKDLRAELEAALKSEFTANLSAGTLPKVVCDSLVELLGASAPISANVIAALGLEGPTQPEVHNE